MLTAGSQGSGGHPLCRSQWGWGRRSPSTGVGGGELRILQTPPGWPLQGLLCCQGHFTSTCHRYQFKPSASGVWREGRGRGVGGGSGGLPSRKLCGLEEPESHSTLCIHPRVVPTLLAQSTHLRSGRMRFQSYSCSVPSGCCGQVT